MVTIDTRGNEEMIQNFILRMFLSGCPLLSDDDGKVLQRDQSRPGLWGPSSAHLVFLYQNTTSLESR